MGTQPVVKCLLSIHLFLETSDSQLSGVPQRQCPGPTQGWNGCRGEHVGVHVVGPQVLVVCAESRELRAESCHSDRRPRALRTELHPGALRCPSVPPL